ncbi:MAG: hypothetical protein HXX13_13690 [Bacteroidetes bacterium]|nr:hypothetical protein [Bacteroidota bacterium]
MKRILLLIIIITAVNYIEAQDSHENNHKLIKGCSISYFGQGFSHYGVKIGREYPLWTKEKIKIKKNLKEIQKNKLIFITGNIGCFIHKRNNVGIFVNSEIGYRKTHKRGFKNEFLFGLGYLHTFLQGDTYEVNDNGSVKKVFLAGRSSLMTSLSCGIGYDFDYYYHKHFSLILKPGFFVQYPFNTAFAARTTIELGFFYNFRQ